MTRHIVLGRSVEGRPIRAYIRSSTGRLVVMVFGGFHGDEPKSVFVARQLIELLRADPAAGGKRTWVIVPLVNPDGYDRRKRRNANRVDLNRNLPTENWVPGSRRSRMYGGHAPASEPESRAVIRAVERFAPSRIISIHSIGVGRFCNNYDGPGRGLAERMGKLNGYPVTGSIGYATPGSLGTWAGAERGIATVTLELPSHHSPKRCWEENRPALLCP